VKRIKALVMRCDKVTATMVLAAVVEQSKWLEFVNSDDQRLAFDAMKFLTQMAAEDRSPCGVLVKVKWRTKVLRQPRRVFSNIYSYEKNFE